MESVTATTRVASEATEAGGESRDLRRCLRDLVALMGLSAYWGRADVRDVAEGLAEALLRSIPADFVYVRVQGSGAESTPEVVRFDPRWVEPCRSHEVAGPLCVLLKSITGEAPCSIADPVGGGTMRVAVVPIGLQSDSGVVVVGSREAGFPTRTDMLLATAGANQAAVVLQHRRVERVLKASEERFRSLSACSPAGIFMTDIEGRCTYTNPRCQAICGFTSEEALGEGWFRFVHQDDRKRVFQDWSATARAGGEYSGEFRFQNSDGPVRWVHVRSSPMSSEEGRFVGHVGTVEDITERKLAAQEREQTLAILNSLVASAPVGIALLDGELRYRLVNAPLAEMNGVSAEEHVGRTVAEIVPDLAPQVEPIFRQVLDTGAAVADQILEGETSQAPGVKRSWRESWFPVAGAGGRPSGVGVIVQEITAERRSDERLRRKNERLRLLSEAASVLLQADDPNAMLPRLFAEIGPHLGLDACLHFIVDEAGDALHLSSCIGIPEEATGSLSRLEFGQAICGTAALLRQPIAASYIQQSDEPGAQLVKSFGLRAYVCNPLVAGDKLLGTLSFGSRTRDEFNPDELAFLQTIGRYVTAAYERVRLIEQLRQADRRKDEFLAMLAHELRNPLAPIRSGLDLLSMEGEERETIALMQEQVEHLVRLVDDLLDVSRIMRGKVELRREPVELKSVVNRAVHTVRHLIEDHRHELTLSLPAEPVWLDADPVRLAQVVANLLNNAAKYTEAGGRISVCAELDRTGALVLRVRDNGVGIDANLLPHVFDLFTQSERSIDRSQGGLGIGLTLVRSLVEMHDGTITAHSDGPGRGSEFAVRLPVLSSVETRVPNEPQELFAPPRRVLVVDDNVGAAKMLRLLMVKCGATDVCMAHDGPAAIEAARNHRPEIILLDIGLPRMSGYEVARRLRDLPEARNTLLVAVTGYGQDEDIQKSREAGFDEHLVKPPAIDTLLQLFVHPKLVER